MSSTFYGGYSPNPKHESEALMEDKKVVFVVTCGVYEDGEEVGRERFEFSFPNRDVSGLDGEQVRVNNISETQPLLGDIAKQAALSATWKAASLFNARRYAAEAKAKEEAGQE
jgi:hypothetical protein